MLMGRVRGVSVCLDFRRSVHYEHVAHSPALCTAHDHDPDTHSYRVCDQIRRVLYTARSMPLAGTIARRAGRSPLYRAMGPAVIYLGPRLGVD